MAVRPAGAGDLNQLSTIFGLGVVGHVSDSQLLLISDQGATKPVRRHSRRSWSGMGRWCSAFADRFSAIRTTLTMRFRPHSWSWPAGRAPSKTPESLASWLTGSLSGSPRAKADEARRRTHERRLATLKQRQCGGEAVRSEPCPELHEEIAVCPNGTGSPWCSVTWKA